MNISKQVIILSAEQTSNTKEVNRERTEKLKGCLSDCKIVFNEAIGVYNNEPAEASLVAIIKDDFDYQAVRDFAFKDFDQEAILHQDANQEAYLVFPTGIQRLGRLEQVTKEVALAKGSYTILNNIYYATIPRT